jgi:outer membrane protein OmpA-like peptidoglycan-associated protein
VSRWTSYRDFWFAFDNSDLQASDASTVSEITAYMNQNPSLRLGIDGSTDSRGTDPRSQTLSARRIDTVRNALIQAGVPAHRIQTGAFGDQGLRRDRRVEVLISSSN